MVSNHFAKAKGYPVVGAKYFLNSSFIVHQGYQHFGALRQHTALQEFILVDWHHTVEAAPRSFPSIL
jgi:hypothetical protein